MPEVTLKVKELRKNHPALTKSGKLKAKARRILQSRTMRSRVTSSEVTPSSWGGSTLKNVADPVRNTELFNRIADEIEYFPESYDQSSWGEAIEGAKAKQTACGTAFCIAGHASHLTGWQPTVPREWDDVVRPRISNQLTVEQVGRRELGLTEAESNFLFDGSWRPKRRYTVPEALREIGNGASILEVSNKNCSAWNRPELEAESPARVKVRVTGKLPEYY